MALIAMEKPCTVKPDDIRDEKLKARGADRVRAGSGNGAGRERT